MYNIRVQCNDLKTFVVNYIQKNCRTRVIAANYSNNYGMLRLVIILITPLHKLQRDEIRIQQIHIL